MKKIISSIVFLAATIGVQAAKPTYVLTVNNEPMQTITGFGAACCDGAMKPFGTDTSPVSKLYGFRSKIGLNIMRMEISPNLEDKADQWGDYD